MTTANRRSNRTATFMIVVGALLMCGAFAIMLATLTNVPYLSDWVEEGEAGYSTVDTGTTFGNPIQVPTPGPSPTPSNQFPPGTEAPVAKLRIPKFEIDSNVVTLGLTEGRQMEATTNAWDTGWYHFTAKPGFGSNAVFSGHVDWHDVGPAVFWHLKDLEQDDTIEVEMADGTVYTYKVTAKQAYPAASAPVNEIVGETPEEVITLITCTGSFNSSTHQYDQRLIVRAERVA